LWSNDSSNFEILVSNPGIYSLTVTDSHSCTASNSITIQNFDELVYSVIIENYNYNQPGSLNVEIAAGDEPVVIIWDDQTTDLFKSDLSPGTYYFTLTDDNGCEYNDSATVMDLSNTPNSLLKSVIVYPNPVYDYLIIESLQNQDVVIQLLDLSGRMVKTIYSDKLKTTIDMSDINSGTYFINIVDIKNDDYRYKIVKQ